MNIHTFIQIQTFKEKKIFAWNLFQLDMNIKWYNEKKVTAVCLNGDILEITFF